MPRFSSSFHQRFAHTLRPSILLASTIIIFSISTVIAAPKPSNLKHQFQYPPADARPMMRWWWFGAAVEKPEILRELQQMKADGIGGVELAFVYPEVVDDPAKGLINEAFVGPEFLDQIHYAQAEGRKLGLRVDVTLGSGWPYGGPATTLEEAAGHLRTIEVAIPPNATAIPYPTLAEGEKPIYIAIAQGEPTHWDASTAQPMPEAASGTPAIQQLSPANLPRVALFFVSSHTRQVVKRAAVGAEGWVLDPFSHQAVATHLKAVADPLIKAFGATPPYAVFSDSLEAYGADWTPSLPAEFKKRRGYDLLPHLPELVAGGTPSAEAVRHAWGRTLTELVDQNYLTQINSWAIAHHTKFRSQTYGEPAVSLSSQRLVALPEGEGPQWRQFSTLRWASSANHLFGNKLTSAETFTWLHSPVFRATPLDMKAEVDLHFLTGVNQIIGHGWPYSPPQLGEPGWSLYAAAVFNDHNPWHPVMPDVTRYIQRISFLLRQGQPANQVALLLPTDDAWASFSPGKVTITGEMAHLINPALLSAILSAGYNVDFIDADTINRLGIHHPILVLPPTDRIPLETLRKIQRYVTAGGKVVSIGRAPSLLPSSKKSPELTTLSQKLFAASRQTFVPDESTLAEALHQTHPPDLKLLATDAPTQDAIGFIRRKLPAADIYFIANTANHPIHAKATFTSTHKFGEQWDPDTTASTPVISSQVELNLAPYESRIIVFTDAPSGSTPNSATPEIQLADLSAGWQLHFTTTNKTQSHPTLTDWTADPTTRFYSGEVIYTRDFTLAVAPTTQTYLQIKGGTPLVNPGTEIAMDNSTTRPAGAPLPNPLLTRTGPGMRAWYDPPIHEAAIVFINGQRAGSLWHPPYHLDVSRFLKPGQNHIEIRVYNTAINAWAALPPHDYSPLIAKYGDRFQMQDLDQVQPLPSGILGQINLVTKDNRTTR